MKKTLACAAFLALLATLTAAPPADGSNFAWTFGTAFNVGGAQFHVSMRDGYFGAPAYFFRTPHRFSGYGGVCHGACYRDAGHFFHHPACPVAGAFFHSHGLSSYGLFARYAPPRAGPRRHGRGRGGPWVAPGHHSGFQAHVMYWAPPVRYEFYGHGNPDRRGARFERWDRRNPNSKSKSKQRHRHYDD